MNALRRYAASAPVLISFAFVVVFLGLPLGRMALETIQNGEGQWSLSAWDQVLATEVDRKQLFYSLQLGLTSTAIAWFFGFGHAWLTHRTNLPGASILAPLAVGPLVVPPILTAMGYADLAKEASGFWPCALLLGVCYAPFVAVLAGRGLRSIDGRLYEAALLARGRKAADLWLVRASLPETLAGCLFAFIFVISEHGVPEFLTVKGKTWHTYAEGVFSRWNRRATGLNYEDVVSPIVTAVPLVIIVVIALWLAMRLRARTDLRSDRRPLPVRSLGAWRFPALLLPICYLGVGVLMPVIVMGRWAAGSTNLKEPMSFGVMRESFYAAFEQSGEDLAYTMKIALVAAIGLVLIAAPLARRSARRSGWIDYLSVLPIAVPGVLLSIGMVKVFNSSFYLNNAKPVTGDLYDSWVMVSAAYATRFLPFGILTLSHAVRRQPRSIDDAAMLSGRDGLARAWAVHLPLLVPAMWSASVLILVLALRELDVAVVLLAGNGTVVRTLSNVVHFGGEDTGGAMALLLLFTAVLPPLATWVITGRKIRELS